MMNVEQLAEALAVHAKTLCMANDMGPREVIAALLTAGTATAFTYLEEGGDTNEVASDVVGFVNAACTNIIEGIENAEETASNG